MPTLPSPPVAPRDDRGWVAQTLPVVASLASIGVLTAASGHALIAVVMIGATLISAALQLDHQRQSRRREIARLRQGYDDLLASLAPAPDWTEPVGDPGGSTDPVCRLLAARHARRLLIMASAPVQARSAVLERGHPDLRAELASGLWLDLREAALGGVGPHGVVVGATGSGKSELLRALVLSLALRHAPEELALLLIDFKGGTALGQVAELPHCVGLITNLAEDDTAVPRMVRALDTELDRRQSVVRQGGRPVPLVVVIDEFSELLGAHPTVLDLLVRIGRLGRSLGLHLVLASQRLDEARLRELEAHLSWRLALRTFTASESRAVLGIPDAAALPREPGWALLRTGPEKPLRLRLAPAGEEFARAAIQAVRLAAASSPPLRPIWLPPLHESPALADLLPPLPPLPPLPHLPPNGPVRGAEWGLSRGRMGSSAVPIGVTDDPVERRVVTIDPDHGHVAIVGRPGSGKSSLLATVEAGLRRQRPDVTLLRVDPRSPQTPPLAPGTVLLVDDWSVLRQEQPLTEELLVRAAIGQPGLRIVLTAHRWADVRAALRDLLNTRIELRLADPLDSMIDRRLAAAVPERQPGRGLIDGEHFVAARSSAEPSTRS